MEKQKTTEVYEIIYLSKMRRIRLYLLPMAVAVVVVWLCQIGSCSRTPCASESWRDTDTYQYKVPRDLMIWRLALVWQMTVATSIQTFTFVYHLLTLFVYLFILFFRKISTSDN